VAVSTRVVADDVQAANEKPMNIYFHSTTAYDVLRMESLPLGKRDFLGNVHTRSSNS